MASGSITINPSLYKRMPFDTKKDLVPITNVASGPMLVVVQDGSPYKTLKDLIAAAKAKPGGRSTSVGRRRQPGAPGGRELRRRRRHRHQHVPYKGEARPSPTSSAGQVQMMVGNFAAARRCWAPAGCARWPSPASTRMPQLPDVPTAHEAGLPGFENIGWFGLFAPAGTPAAVIDKVQRDTAKVLAETEIKARLFVQGMSPVVNSTADFHAEARSTRNWSAGPRWWPPASCSELRRGPVKADEHRPAGRRRGRQGALHPRAEGAAARHQGRLRAPAARESGATAQSVLGTMVPTSRWPSSTDNLLCQDTGIPIYNVTIGRGVRWTAALKQALRRGCERATREYPLRSSVVHPLTRKNEHTSCGIEVPVIHIDFSDTPDTLEHRDDPQGQRQREQLVPEDGIPPRASTRSRPSSSTACWPPAARPARRPSSAWAWAAPPTWRWRWPSARPRGRWAAAAPTPTARRWSAAVGRGQPARRRPAGPGRRLHRLRGAHRAGGHAHHDEPDRGEHAVPLGAPRARHASRRPA
jgi:hypothetical protein